MKKYNWLILLIVTTYIMIASSIGVFFTITQNENQRLYRIEANRIASHLSKVNDINSLNMEEYDIIKSVSFLDSNETDQNKIQSFYEEDDHMIFIQPWYEDTKLKGYIKFSYQEENHNKNLFLVIEMALLLLFLIMLGVLLFVKNRIMLPFYKLSDMPKQLAKGHYHGDVKIEKSRYFQNYLWGMSQLKDTLDVTKKREYALMKDKKQMLLSLSHDIKTPLNLIKLYAKALEDNIYNNEASRYHAIKQIEFKSDEIERYVEQIITSSKNDIINFEIEMKEFYLSDLMQNILSVYKEQCNNRNIDFIVGEYKNRFLKGDIHRAQEVLDNLFENAIKYGDGQRIEIDFYEEDYCQIIRLFNTGEIICDNEVHHLFDSFFRGINASSKQGSGLGLYICKILMRKMGGDIFVECKKEGMAFMLVFH